MALRDTLIYERQFNGMPSDWRDRTGATVGGEFASVSPGMSWTYDGRLVLAVKPDPHLPGKYLVGQVESETLFNTYGFYEAEVIFPTAPGVLAGWWLQPEPPYATANHIEIDIAENAGNPNIHHTLWVRADEAGNMLPWGSYRKIPDPHFTTDLGRGVDEPQAKPRRYGMRVTPTGYTWFIDGERVASWNQPVVEVPTRMVFSLKIPSYLIDDLNPDNLGANKMKVGWVRKYAL